METSNKTNKEKNHEVQIMKAETGGQKFGFCLCFRSYGITVTVSRVTVLYKSRTTSLKERRKKVTPEGVR